MDRIEKTIFISYRRTNVPWALAISQYLTNQGYDVFFDFMSINSGDFEQTIIENIKARAHFLVLLAPSVLDRCDETNDWLRREIEVALENKRNIVPILLEHFDFGAPETKKYLTGKLDKLRNYNGLNIYADYFIPGMQRLCDSFLNIPLDAVKHPVSRAISKSVKVIVEEQKHAVSEEPLVDGKTLSAQVWFERAYILKDPKERIRLYTRVIELNPKFVYAYNNRGNCYNDQKQYERAIEDLNQAIKLNPEYATAYNNRGNSYSELKQYERAIEDYDKAIKLNPEYATAYNNRGNSYSELKQYEQAIQDYDKSIVLNPEYATAYNNRGNCYNDQKQYERAIEDLNQAIMLNSEYAPAYNNRGNSYAELKQYERAIKDLNQAIRLNPEYEMAYNNRGNSYAELKQYERAIEDLNQAIKLNPEHATAYNNRGNSYSDLKQYERAIEDYDKSIKLNPEYATAYNGRGVSYARLKQYERAIEDFKKALKLDPKGWDSYYCIACTNALQGKVVETTKWLRKALLKDAKKYCELLKHDNDFDRVRGEIEFQNLLKEICDKY